MTLSTIKTAGIAVGIAVLVTQTMAADTLAVGQRVTVNFAGGKEGTVVKIGTAADGTYAGCTRIHFDYEGPDPTTGQWFCAWNSPLTITPLGGQRVAQIPAPAGPMPNPAHPPAPQAVHPPTPNAPPPGAVACPVANAANLGGGAQGRNIAAAIQAIMNHPAPAGMDGAESATILSLQVGGARAWSVADSLNFSADPNQPVYDVQATLKLCTDYQAAIDIRQEVSNFECFTSPAEQFACQMSGTVNGMPGPTQRINK